MFFSFFNFKSLYEYLGNHKDLPSRSQNSVLLWNTLRTVSSISWSDKNFLLFFSNRKKEKQLVSFFSQCHIQVLTPVLHLRVYLPPHHLYQLYTVYSCKLISYFHTSASFISSTHPYLLIYAHF